MDVRCPHCGAILPDTGDGTCPDCSSSRDDSLPLFNEIDGLAGLSNEEIDWELRNGAKFVVYHYCVSIIVWSFFRTSQVHFIRSNESAVWKGMKYTLLSLLLGWWGVPFGPIFTIIAIVINLFGGRNMTPPNQGLLETQAQG